MATMTDGKELCEALKGVNHENVKKRYGYNLTVTCIYRMVTDSWSAIRKVGKLKQLSYTCIKVS